MSSATDKFCSFCYKYAANIQKCGKCRKRYYCSKECQIKDWKEYSHKVWCGKSGEINYDYEIKYSIGKGLGVFAKREFNKGEKIMIERPWIMDSELNNPPERTEEVMKQLLPINGTLIDKFKLNCMACDDESEGLKGLFINMSRINHNCLENSSHYYLENQKIKMLIACNIIKIGEEITIAYCTDDSFPIRRQLLKAAFGFECNCQVCTNQDLESKIIKMYELDKTILKLGQSYKIEEALEVGQTLIKIYDELNMPYNMYARTYYDMFQMANTEEEYIETAKKYAQKASDYALLFYGKGNSEEIEKYQEYAINPWNHYSYLRQSEDCGIQ